MWKKTFETLLGFGFFLVIILMVAAFLSWLFHWNLPNLSPNTLLNAGAGFICLTGLIFILRVPWDLYFETKSLLFEMQRSLEMNIPVKPERQTYVRRMRWITFVIAVGSHIVSAAIIAGVTYWSNGQVGYYFAGFYLLATFFRPINEAHRFLIEKLREIRGEVKYPRDDVLKLVNDVKEIKEGIKTINERLKAMDERFHDNEETDRKAQAQINDLKLALERTDLSFRSRIQQLTDEVERSLSKAFDHQDIVNGLRAFAKLIKEA